MEEIKKQVRNPLTVGITGLVVGTLFGLIVLGWWLWPVKWINATPAELAPSYQQEYLKMSIIEYSYTGNVEAAIAQYEALEDKSQQTLLDVGKNLGTITQQDYAAYVMVVEPEQATSIAMGTPEAPTEKEGGGSVLGFLIPILCGILIAVGAAVGIYFILRKLPQRAKGGAQPETKEPSIPTQVEAPAATQPVMAQFMTTYGLGDDQYDDSFSIDSPAGEFLGECGAGISETIGVGDPKKVTAFEVWLFDKNDIQTVTKVLMSAYAYNDEATRSRLAAKGEPELITPGSEIVLETQTLQMVIRVVDMAYGEGQLPPESFFERLVLELSVWSKS